MSNYKKYAVCLERSVKHIFKNFLADDSISDVIESQTDSDDFKVWIELEGTIEGEIEIRLKENTLKEMTRKLTSSKRVSKASYKDVAGELANLITGTLANQLQYINHNLVLSPPEFDEDPIQMKTLYENICLSFTSKYGGFDIETYYKENE